MYKKSVFFKFIFAELDGGRGLQPGSPPFGCASGTGKFLYNGVCFNCVNDIPYLFTPALDPMMTSSNFENFDSKEVAAVCVLTIQYQSCWGIIRMKSVDS